MPKRKSKLYWWHICEILLSILLIVTMSYALLPIPATLALIEWIRVVRKRGMIPLTVIAAIVLTVTTLILLAIFFFTSPGGTVEEERWPETAWPVQ